MADGGLGATFERADEAGIPMAWVRAGTMYEKKSGPCDTQGTNDRNRLQQWRYATGLFQWAVGADGVLAAGTELTLWKEGVDDVGTLSGWGATLQLTNAQTNLFTKGAFNNSAEGSYLGRGLGFSFMRSFQYTAASGARSYSDATDRYAARAARAISEALEIAIRDKDDDLASQVARPEFWGSHAQIADEQFPTIGSCITPQSTVPMRRDYLLLNDVAGSKTSLTLRLPHAVTLVSDPAVPVPANFSTPILVVVYGKPLPTAEVCGPKGGVVGFSLADEVAKLRAQGIELADAIAMAKMQMELLLKKTS